MGEGAIAPRIVKLAEELRAEGLFRPPVQASSCSARQSRTGRVQILGLDGKPRVEIVQLSAGEKLVRANSQSAYAVVGDSQGDENYRIRVYASGTHYPQLVYEDAPISPRVYPFGCGFLWIRRDATFRPYQAMWLDPAHEHPSAILGESDPTRRLDIRSVVGDLAILASRDTSTRQHWIVTNRAGTTPEYRRLHTGARDADAVLWRGGTAVLDRDRGMLHVTGPEPFEEPMPRGFIGQYLQAIGDTLVVIGRKDSRFSVWAPMMGADSIWTAPPAGTMLASMSPTNRQLVFLVTSPIHRPQVVAPDRPGTIDAESTGRARTYTLSAESNDGARVPVTLFVPAGNRPRGLVVHVYGAYGISLEGPFDPFTDDLLSRGIAIAYCHVRGGGENGPEWHRLAVGTHRERSIADLFAGLSLLRQHPAISADRIVLSAASAGGLTAATAALRKPTRFRGLHLVHPFLDPITSLADPGARLTTTDWTEFGDPRTSAEIRAILERLSPVKIVAGMTHRSEPLPRAWIRGARNDARVDPGTVERFSRLYRSAACSTDPGHVVYRTVGGGHLGGSPISQEYEENVLSHAWLIDTLRA